jgi:hypothetical protein
LNNIRRAGNDPRRNGEGTREGLAKKFGFQRAGKLKVSNIWGVYFSDNCGSAHVMKGNRAD